MFLETDDGFINVNRIEKISEFAEPCPNGEGSRVAIVYWAGDERTFTWSSEYAANCVLERTNSFGRVSPI